MATNYDKLLPVARKLVKGLSAKPGVWFVNKEIVSQFLAQALTGMINRGELILESKERKEP